jgi:hypothetical protein
MERERQREKERSQTKQQENALVERMCNGDIGPASLEAYNRMRKR